MKAPERAPGPGEVSEWLRYSPPPLSAVPDIPGSLETVLDQLRRGGMVIVCDDPDRENEGDLCVAAQFVTAEVIAFTSDLTTVTGVQVRRPTAELVDA